MPEEQIVTQTPPVVTTESNVAHNLDSELDAALSKQFTNFTPEKNETKKEEPKAQEKQPEQKEIQADKVVAKEVSKDNEKSTKGLEQDDKALVDPDAIDADPKLKGQAAWNALKSNYKRSLKKIEERDQDLTKVKTTLAEKEAAHQKELESLKSEREQLSKYRAMVDIQADPEFLSKFDAPINEKVASMKELLKGWNVGDEVINQINFLDKNSVGLIAKALRKGEEHIKSEFELEEFMSNAKEVLELSKKKDKELKTHGDNYKEILENKKKEAFSKGAEEEGRMIKHLENVAVGKDRDGNQKFSSIPFLNKATPKEGASQLEIDQANNHNKMVDLMTQKIKSAMKINSPEDKMEMIVSAVGSAYLQAQLKGAMAKIKSLEDQVSKISAASTETEKVKPNRAASNGNGQLVRADEALENYFGRR